MKLIPLLLLVACSGAMASGQAPSSIFGGSGQQQRQQATTTSTNTSTSEASNSGNTQSIIFTSPGESTTTVRHEGGTRQEVVSSGTARIKNVPSVGGPSLASSNDTCMGSVSGSLNVAGFGGSLGKTYKDDNCVMLKNSRELWNMGMRAAALARMCMDADNRDALEMTGFKCPQTEKAERAAASSQVRPQEGPRPAGAEQ